MLKSLTSIETKDIIPGLLTAVVMVATSTSYAALIFSGSLAFALPIGIGYSMIGAAIVGIVFAVGSGIPFAIAGPDSKLVAVLATLAAVASADLIAHGQVVAITSTVVVALVVGTVITGLALYLFGHLKIGS